MASSLRDYEVMMGLNNYSCSDPAVSQRAKTWRYCVPFSAQKNFESTSSLNSGQLSDLVRLVD